MKTDFIYGKFINKDFCEKVINFFEDNHRIHRYDDKSNRSFTSLDNLSVSEFAMPRNSSCSSIES